jgi:tRNA(Ile)-lysidine synthase
VTDSGDRPPLTPEDRAASDEVLLHFAQTAFIADPSLQNGTPARIGVAVSGGSDSMALLHLFHRAFPGKISAVTVDHGLRVEAAAEAAGVAAFCALHGIAHKTLRWQGPEPIGNLMDQARRARLSLIAAWAKADGISHVLMGHTADDQAESFLMNLARKAGLDGLSGMRREWDEQGIRWMRPFLHLHRQDLRDYLKGQGVTWIDDPSNDNDRYTRVKARKILKTLAPLGITAETLAQSVTHLSASRQALNWALYQAIDQSVVVEAGAVRLAARDYHRMMPDLQRRALVAIIGWMTGGGYAPREAQLFRLGVALDQRADATLAGLRFQHRQDRVMITREPRAVMGAVPFGQVWDHRWRIVGPSGAGLEIRALGAGGLALCPDWRDHGPRVALLVSPALWMGETLIAAPLAGNPGQYRAELTQTLTDFILSH